MSLVVFVAAKHMVFELVSLITVLILSLLNLSSHVHALTLYTSIYQ
jgi:hypothetical protein